MSDNEQDAIARFCKEAAAGFRLYDRAAQHDPVGRDEALAEYVTRALAEVLWYKANAAWKALADERAKRESGGR